MADVKSFYNTAKATTNQSPPSSAYFTALAETNNGILVKPKETTKLQNFGKNLKEMLKLYRKTGHVLIVVRHGEKVDQVFPSWMELSFRSDPKIYQPYDLNLPFVLPRPGHLFNDFKHDSPITEIGNIQAQMIGRVLGLYQIRINDVYSSPSLACLQSARALVQATSEESGTKIKVEHGLFEWMGLYKEETPKWLNNDLCCGNGIEIDTTYQPIIDDQTILTKYAHETVAEYYGRTKTVVNSILVSNAKPGAVVVVGHASTLDAGTRHLRGKCKSLPSDDEMNSMGTHFPNCSTVILQQYRGGQWKLPHRFVPHLTFANDRTNMIDNVFFNRD